jgi:hypothetical protein
LNRKIPWRTLGQALSKKKLQEFTLHCDITIPRRRLPASHDEKKVPPSVGRRHQFRGLIPRYVLHSVRQRNRLTNRDHSAFADNSLIFEFFPSTQPMVCAI